MNLFKKIRAKSHEPLTAERREIMLCSRSYFNRRLRAYDNGARLPLSVVICDINGLTLISDTLGESETARMLEGAQTLISGYVRKDDIIARSGERFFILLPRTGSKEADLIARRIVNASVEACETSGRLCVSISAGSATKRQSKENIYTILRAAEHKINIQKRHGQNGFYDSLLRSIKKALFEKSHETEEHGERMVNLSRMLGEALGLHREQLSRLKVLATLHDIGKVSVDEAILTKPGSLDSREWDEIKKHPEAGFKIADAVPQLKDIADDILSHHERWDGEGYPRGLRGEEIPLHARIISVVDAYDTLTSKRCYRDPVSAAEALAEIEKNAGTQFDPHIAAVFLRLNCWRMPQV